MKQELSLIIPCYQEGGHLLNSYKRLTQELKKIKITYELIFVEDKSTDNTKKIINHIKLKDKKVRAIYHNKNVGRGGSLTDGIKITRYNLVGFLDIDLEISEKYISKFLEKLKTHDVVIATRQYKSDINTIQRLMATKCYILLSKLILNLPFKDTEAGYKFFRRNKILPIIKIIKDKKWFWDTEIVALSYASGLKIGEVSVLFKRNPNKKSTVRLLHDSWEYFISLIKFRETFKKMETEKNSLSKFWKDMPERFDKSYQNKGNFKIFVNNFLNSRLNLLIDLIKPLKIKKALDVGCGSGQYMKKLINLGIYTAGIDYSKKMIELAKVNLREENHKKFILKTADANHLPFRASTFDFALAVGLLEYLSNPSKAVSEITRILKPNGYCVISFSKKWSPFFLLRVYPGSILRKKFLGLPELATVFDLKDIQKFAKENNLQTVKIKEIMLTEYLVLFKKKK